MRTDPRFLVHIEREVNGVRDVHDGDLARPREARGEVRAQRLFLRHSVRDHCVLHSW